MVTRNMKWISIPILLIGSMFSQLTGRYELPLELTACVGAALLAVWAIRSGEYFWAGSLGLVVIAFSPVPLVNKIFLLMGYASIASVATLVVAFRIANPMRSRARALRARASLSIAGTRLSHVPERTA
jgi:hypothetical protein